MEQSRVPDRALRVLVADDDFLVATGVANAIKSIGFQCIGPVPSGEEALTRAAEEPADLALLDIQMPGADGLSVADTLWRRHGIPTVLLSAYSDDEYVKRASSTGVFGYLVKPVNPDALKTTLQVAWARAQGSNSQSERIAELEATLAQRRVIEEAKWKLVAALGIAEPEAHRRIQVLARSSRITMAQVAKAVIEAKEVPAALRT